MYEPVLWLSDGSPHSPRFNDRYRSRTGGLAQALSVREDLKGLGFSVKKCPGLPPKRHRLQATYAPG